MPSLVTRYAEQFGLPAPPVPVSLGEGDTPLIPSIALGPRWGLKNLFFKADHLNPTGSYKDRFTVFAVNRMLALGQRLCLATSSGNAGSSLAAFAARAGISVVLAINEVTPAGKLSQMAAHGARLLRVKGFGKDPDDTDYIWNTLNELATAHDVPLLITAFKYQPLSMRGVSTMSYEIADQLGALPDAVFVPTGGGGLYSGITLGFQDLGGSVRMEPVQPSGNDTIISPIREGLAHARPLVGPQNCSISGLSVPTDIDGTRAVGHAHRTGGQGFIADEGFIREVQADLYRYEGLSVEPAGAVAVAGVKVAVDEGRLDPHETAVAVLTGSGYKDPNREKEIADLAPVTDITRDDLSAELLFGPTQGS